MSRNSNYLVILAGGSGTRLWPLSRKDFPKQFLKIGSEESLVRQTFTRLKDLVPAENVLIVCGKDHCDLMRQEFPDFNSQQFILEPCGRNTAPAIALAAKVLLQKDPEAAMVVLPADHKIPEASCKAFQDLIAQALQFSREMNGLITLGVQPTFPATGYGYIQQGDELAPALYKVKQFREKPDAKTAQQYLESGGYFWNSGMFIWKAAEFWKNYEKHLPPDALILSSLGSPDSADWPKKLEELYPRVTSISVDYAVMEKSNAVQMMKASFEWDDVGSLQSLGKYLTQDKQGNAVQGQVVSVDATGNLLIANEGVVACLGVSGLIIIRDKESVLVLPQERSEEVKQILEELKKNRLEGVL